MLKLSRMHMSEMEMISVCDTIYTISCSKNDTFLIQDRKAVIFYSIKGYMRQQGIKAFFFYHCVAPPSTK